MRVPFQLKQILMKEEGYSEWKPFKSLLDKTARISVEIAGGLPVGVGSWAFRH